MTKKKCEVCLHYGACLLNSEYMPTPCAMWEDKSDHRKQSEGEWVSTDGAFTVCSNCETWSDVLQGTANFNFCPNCGAKMKGGE